ncbi:uncharacterized protein J3D65DRAFT_619840 [Phyllosticta citribraziliensis]|uniref:DUF1989 domain-containing protein n=1 Tax=Phyllosticta citribraziliensis TaxID=989973 RepID=A0ABR1LYJ8_9PEZI
MVVEEVPGKQVEEEKRSPQRPTRSWSAYASYVPSLRLKSKNQASSTAAAAKDAKADSQRTAPSSSYASYLPTLRARAKEAPPPAPAPTPAESAGADKGDLKEDDKSLQSTSDYVSAEEGEVEEKARNDDEDSGQETDKQGAAEKDGEGKEEQNDLSASATSTKSWGSYLPSIRRGKGLQSSATAAKWNPNAKGWLSYIPSGKSFTSYLPSSGKEALSAFAASHYRDPDKSYGEQLYEFSKTPVGAFSLSAAAGSGTAGSLYAAYNAYVKLQATRRSTEPMEYLSLPHTMATSTHVSPQPGDSLVTNLRNPLLTLLDDTTPEPTTTLPSDDGGSSPPTVPLRHGTLLPACDPAVYKQLAALAGRARGEEHGSCAENLVLALQSFNASAGLKGGRAVGADVTINSAPTPLSLFLNCGVRQAGEEVCVAPPRTYDGGKMGRPGMKGGWVLFRAERDVVVVLSACPMEVGEVNGGRCMAANFVVEEPLVEPQASTAKTTTAAHEEEEAEKLAKLEMARAFGRALGAKVPQRSVSVQAPGGEESTETLDNKSVGSQSPTAAGEVRNRARPGRRKPKKLERRSRSGAEVK